MEKNKRKSKKSRKSKKPLANTLINPNFSWKEAEPTTKRAFLWICMCTLVAITFVGGTQLVMFLAVFMTGLAYSFYQEEFEAWCTEHEYLLFGSIAGLIVTNFNPLGMFLGAWCGHFINEKYNLAKNYSEKLSQKAEPILHPLSYTKNTFNSICSKITLSICNVLGLSVQKKQERKSQHEKSSNETHIDNQKNTTQKKNKKKKPRKKKKASKTSSPLSCQTQSNPFPQDNSEKILPEENLQNTATFTPAFDAKNSETVERSSINQRTEKSNLKNNEKTERQAVTDPSRIITDSQDNRAEEKNNPSLVELCTSYLACMPG